jgi:peptidoglycan/xylan/chitin deacetylase (PgdA/CDA1 family)
MTITSWPDGRRVAVVFNVAYESWSAGNVPALGPMGNPLPPGIPDLQADSFGRYGRGPGIARLAGILDQHGVAATVMVSGVLAEQAPDSVRELAAAGHDLCAHSYSQNILPGALEPEAERAEITNCRDLLTQAAGVAPRGWMSPRGTPSPRTGDLLVELGFDWHGDAFDQDVPVVEQHPGGPLVAVPFHMEINDLPVCLKNGNGPEALWDRYLQLVTWCTERETGPLHIDVTVHAHYFGRPGGAWVYDRILSHAAGRPDLWIATRSQIADWALSQ